MMINLGTIAARVATMVLFVSAIAVSAAGQTDVTAPGDPISAIHRDSMNNEMFSAPGDSPLGEEVERAIDDDIFTKYLNFNQTSGFIVSPASGSTRITSIRFTTANDAPERDPITFELYGSAAAVAPAPGTAGWTLITSGSTGLAVDPGRFSAGPTISFANAAFYSHYKLVVTSVRDPMAADSMQVAEVELISVGAFGATVGVGPASLGNQDSCDIAVVPAATLFLPYFEVDYDNTDRTTALDYAFTITNVSDVPAIAHVTVWTDWSFPVLDFNIFLTGYDVQGISLYDVLNSGTLPQTSLSSPTGTRSRANTNNPHFDAASIVADCSNPPGNIPPSLLAEVNSALTGGSYFGCDQVGGTHANAIGYITIDTVNTCSQSLPTDPNYFATEMLFDNQLIGDYLRLNPSDATGNFAGGNPLVHIRAVPPGGLAGSVPVGLNLPYTFYDRFTAGNATGNRRIDRRQPLPALFAARFIGTPFSTTLAIWHEGTATQAETANCDVDENSSIAFTEFVRFDERENSSTAGGGCTISPCPPGQGLPETSAPPITSTLFPPRPVGSTDVGGWLYANLATPGSVNSFSPTTRPSQNWITIRMTAEGTYGADFDAAYLGNGCTPRLDITANNRTGSPRIGPQYFPGGTLP